MARVKKNLIQIEGKLGDHIVSREGRYKSYIRHVVKAGTKKDEPALKQQYSRTGVLNALASDINTIVKENSEGLKSGGFYGMLLRCFRKEPLNNRLLLLQTLKGMEVNPAYPFVKHGVPDIYCSCAQAGLSVRIAVNHHPAAVIKGIDTYYYEVVAASWTRAEKAGDCERQYSEWISMAGPEPVFDFFFKKPRGVIHWMVCVRIRLGVHEAAAESFKADGMQVIDSGSFDKREQEWLVARKEQEEEPVKRKAKKPVKIVRVKAN